MGVGETVKDAWHTAATLPPKQVSDQLEKWYTSDPSSWPLATERVATATLISSVGFLAGEAAVAAFPELIIFSALLPWAMPVVAGVTEVVVDQINDFLNNFGLGHRDYCTFDPQWQTKKMDDPLWIHYPGRVGVPAKGNEVTWVNGIAGPPYRYGGIVHPGWGALGFNSLTPDLRDYPWIQNLSTGYGPDLASLPVLTIPNAIPGSFEDFWYRIYARIKEVNALQKCIRLTPGDADKQEEALLYAQAFLWNQFHSDSSSQTFSVAPHAGDDLLLAPHQKPVSINRGALIKGPWRSRPTLQAGAVSSSSTAASLAKGVAIVAATGLAGAAVYSFVTKKPFVGVLKSGWRKTGTGFKKALHLRGRR